VAEGATAVQRVKVIIRHVSNPYYYVQEGLVFRVKPGGVLEKVEPVQGWYLEGRYGKKVLVEALYELNEGDVIVYTYDYSYGWHLRYGAEMAVVGKAGLSRAIAYITLGIGGGVVAVSDNEIREIYRETYDKVQSLAEYARRKGLV